MSVVPTRGTPSTFVISHTPFTEGGDIDWDGVRAHLSRFKDAGIGVYMGGGGSGEGYTLLPHEMRQLLDVAVEELKGIVPVRAMGVEPRTAREMIAFGETAAESGVDAMQVYSLDVGHLGVPSPDDLDKYFTEVLEHVSLPVVLSTHFSVGYLVPVDLIARLCARYDSIIGVNCSLTGDLTYLVKLLGTIPAHVEVHVGGPIHALSSMAMGGTGFLSSEANLAPRLAVSVIDAYAAGDYVGAQVGYHKMMQLFALGMEGKGGKSLQRHLGLPGGHPRPPRHDRSTVEGLQSACRALDALDIAELQPFLDATAH